MALRCESRSGLFRPCADSAIGVCVHCRKPFCGRHGTRYTGSGWVCYRGRCEMKAHVTATVLSARQAAAPRNAENRCGAAECAGRLPGTTCSLCLADYCVLHLNSRTFRILEPTPVDQPDAPPHYRRERRYLCDSCVGAIDKYRLITLPPIPDSVETLDEIDGPTIALIADAEPLPMVAAEDVRAIEDPARTAGVIDPGLVNEPPGPPLIDLVETADEERFTLVTAAEPPDEEAADAILDPDAIDPADDAEAIDDADDEAEPALPAART